MYTIGEHTHSLTQSITTEDSPAPPSDDESFSTPDSSYFMSGSDISTSENSEESSEEPPSDDESFHSATEELDEPVRPHPTATDESIPPIVQSLHRMDQQETSEDTCS